MALQSLGGVTLQPQAQTKPEDLGINLKKPKFPHYAPVLKRLETFKTWPKYSPVGADVLAEAGLVYTGKGDSCLCYFCGGGIRHWEEGDDPWWEHAKWYPGCGHVFLAKGSDFIRQATGTSPAVEHERRCENDNSDKSLTDERTNIVVLSFTAMGCDIELVKRAIQTYRKRYGRMPTATADVMDIVMEMEEEGDTNTNFNMTPHVTSSVDGFPNKARETLENQEQAREMCRENSQETPTKDDPDSFGYSDDPEALLQENERLKDSQTCKICLDARANVIFLPCGHMISCPLCAPALVKCPVCRVRIRGTVRAYLAEITTTC